MYSLNISSTVPISGDGDILMLSTTTRTPRAVTKVRMQFLPAKQSKASSPCREETQLFGLSTQRSYSITLNNQIIRNMKRIG